MRKKKRKGKKKSRKEEKAERISDGGRRGERVMYYITFYQFDSQPVGGQVDRVGVGGVSEPKYWLT